MSAPPRVSAIVTSYQHEAYLSRAVESALAQDVDGLEVIVIDDASTDGTPAVLDALPADPRLRIERHATNRGVSPTFNEGLALARGEYVAYVGSDDYWLPGHLAGALAVMHGSDTGFSYARVRVVDGDDRDITERAALFGRVPDEGFFAELAVRSNFVPFVSVMMRRDVALAVGGFDDRLVTLQDYALWLRIAAAHPVRFRDEVVAAFRWHGGNTSRRDAENSVRFRRELGTILEGWRRERPADLQRAGVEEAVRKRLAGNYRRLARRLSDPADRVRCYAASLRLDAFQPSTVARLVASAVRALPGAFASPRRRDGDQRA